MVGFCLCKALGVLWKKPLGKNKEFILRIAAGLVETFV